VRKSPSPSLADAGQEPAPIGLFDEEGGKINVVGIRVAVAGEGSHAIDRQDARADFADFFRSQLNRILGLISNSAVNSPAMASWLSKTLSSASMNSPVGVNSSEMAFGSRALKAFG